MLSTDNAFNMDNIFLNISIKINYSIPTSVSYAFEDLNKLPPNMKIKNSIVRKEEDHNDCVEINKRGRS